MKIWNSKNQKINQKVDTFLSGEDIRLDNEIFIFDVDASIAHIEELLAIKLLTGNEASSLKRELKKIKKDFLSGKLTLNKKFEDCHSAIVLKKKDKSEIKNFELVQELYQLVEQNNIKYEHIKAHTGLDDEHSYGNEQADRLANNAIGNFDIVKRISLSIPFDSKDKAKELGAKWDKDIKKWYYDGTDNSVIEELKKLEVKEHYLNIPFANKDKAKSLGAKWDANVKKWFYVDNLDADKIAGLLKLSK